MIRIGIAGYGNIGKGVEKAVNAATDMELRAVFTRRGTDTIKLAGRSIPILPIDDAEKMSSEIDVMVLCGSSSSDLHDHGPRFASCFNIVDSFDTHAKIPEYMATVQAAATKTTAIISAGWDPGLFSMVRALSEAVLPDGSNYTFWGEGVSQGHSNAIRSIEGVKMAVQYSVPIQDAIDSVRRGERPDLTARQKHLRKCYVVAEPAADKASIEQKIVTMPDYFADYDTTVTFIGEDEFIANHQKMPHGGLVIRSGKTGSNEQVIEYSLKLDSNPEFTGSIMAAYARAAYKMAADGLFGAKTVLDVPLAYLSDKDRNTLIKELL
ncbi:MAG: diaminopimelate dehydrogenase [Oscillospiraceae bacterium]|nr:diaminopimelate dehydrogenase [Oscillospiraceae bacterium]